MNESDSKVISAIRFPLAIMVVAIHSYITIDGWSYSQITSQGLGSNCAQFFMIAIAHVLAHIAVPTFFLISGYLFFNNYKDGSISIWKYKFSNRIKTLLIPYILWIFLYIIWSGILNYKDVLQNGLGEWLISQGGLKMFWNSNTWNLDRVDIWGQPAISSSPILFPFWFIRDLMVCIIVTPIFYWLFRPSSPLILKIIGLLFFSILYFSQTSLHIPGLNSSSLFFFGIGSVLSLNHLSLIEVFSRFKTVLWILFSLFFIIEVSLYGHNTFMGNILYPIYVFVGVLSFITIRHHESTKYQHHTFFIYAFHIFILPFVGAILSKLICIITGETIINNITFANKYPILIILEFCLKIILTIVICIGICTLFKKYCPKSYRILCVR